MLGLPFALRGLAAGGLTSGMIACSLNQRSGLEDTVIEARSSSFFQTWPVRGVYRPHRLFRR
jgi:hypothetical protein